MMTIEIQWPSSITQAMNVVSKGSPAGLNSFSIECFYSMIKGNNEEIYFFKLIALVIQPFILMVIWMGLILSKAIKNRKKKGFKVTFMKYTIVACLVTFYMMQPEILRNTFRMFNCIELDQDGKKSYMAEQVGIECWSEKHKHWIYYSALPILFVYLLLPLLGLVMVCFKRKKIVTNPVAMQRYGFLFKKYRTDLIGWDLLILIKKVLIILVIVLVQDLQLKLFYANFIAIIMLILHARIKPFRQGDMNQLETWSLFSHVSLLFGGIFLSKFAEFGAIHYIVVSICLGVNAIFLWLGFRAAVVIMRAQIERARKLCKKNCIRRSLKKITI